MKLNITGDKNKQVCYDRAWMAWVMRKSGCKFAQIALEIGVSKERARGYVARGERLYGEAQPKHGTPSLVLKDGQVLNWDPFKN